MILLVPSIILAFIVLAWIAWIGFGPHTAATPSTPFAANALLGPAGDDEDRENGSETDFQRHVRNRIEESPIPFGTVSGAALPIGGRMSHRIADPPSGHEQG
jgi:hypothetical protein